MGAKPLQELSKLGQSVWIDSLSRASIRGGHLQSLIEEDSVVGATSNPTIFQKAMSEGDAYDEQLRELADRDPGDAFWALAVRDIKDACDVFRGVFDATSGCDGYVSLEVDPTLAYETLQTFREAIDLHETVDRPNLLVKIPATKPGLAAIEDVIARGRSINVTLIFSLRRYAEVAESYIRGIERLVAAGGDPGKVASVASFFVSRIDTEADRRLDQIGGHDELKGKLAVANARLAYEHCKTAFAGPRWEFLAGKGATPQRVLWASTSVKNPAYPDTLYVDELIGPDTVNTMPGETIDAYQDRGDPKPRLEEDLEEAHALFERLAAAGVSYEEITDTCEREGVAKFSASFTELLDGLRAKQASLAAA
jgi:transaldolase